jgi:predicted ATPase
MGGGGGGEREEMFFTEREAFAALLGERLRGRDLVEGWIEVQGGRGLQLTGTVGDEDEEARTNKRFGLVHASFTQLCEQPLGTADYDALCTATDTIFLAGLRRFRADEKDAVRRFITLVDIAYERGTRVVCLSEVPLAEVFVNIVRVSDAVQQKLAAGMRVRRGGGASSSMMSTFVGDTEWSATGLREASLATGGAGETDVGFAVGRAISRIYEMGAKDYAILRQ